MLSWFDRRIVMMPRRKCMKRQIVQRFAYIRHNQKSILFKKYAMKGVLYRSIQNRRMTPVF
ncbi:hypothetical protein A9Q96_00035 [Rhodobacterales bacterium 52_120_T64]|nr:hypothetical protein A9Q96_00035 [Rhodobacterales bacterium 52_120_T64]